MATESIESKKKRALEIIKRLKKNYPAAKIELNFKNPIQLVVAVILSAQCTDKRVNLVTPALFRKYKTIKDYANANPKVFEKMIHSTGFYQAKTKSIINCARELVKRFGGEIPDRMEDLVTLPGIGRYTAGAISSIAFQKPVPLVDGNVARVFSRLFNIKKDILKSETQKEFYALAEKLIPQKNPGTFNQALMELGSLVCISEIPKC